jgi:hypothetical protein
VGQDPLHRLLGGNLPPHTVPLGAEPLSNGVPRRGNELPAFPMPPFRSAKQRLPNVREKCLRVKKKGSKTILGDDSITNRLSYVIIC